MYRNSKLCRLCLVEVDTLVPIFTTKNVSETSSLQMKIMELANVQVYAGDGLPSSVCINCSKLLDSYHAFKVQIEKADVILRHQLSTNQVDPLSIETKIEGETTVADVLKAETVLIKEEEIPEDQVENILQPSLSPSATHSPLPSPSASPAPVSLVNNDEDDETPDGNDNEVDPLSADITDPPDPPTDSTTVTEQDEISPSVSTPIPVVSSVGNQVISSVPIISSGINQNTTLAPVSVISTGVNQVASISPLPVISGVTGGVNRTTNLASVPVISSGTNQATNLAPLPIISSVSGGVNQATSLASVPVISGGGVNQPTSLLLVATPLIVSSNNKNQDLSKKSVTTVVGNTNTFVDVPALYSVTAPTTFVTVPSSTVTSATHNLDKTSIESKDPLDVSDNDPGPSTSNAGINKVGESSSSNEAQPKVTDSDSLDGHTCTICQKLFKSTYELRNHRLKDHRGVEAKCDICFKVLASSDRIRRHKYFRHPESVSFCRCNICGHTFKFTEYLDKHMKRAHSVNCKKWCCDICGKAFTFKYLLRTHKINTHSDKQIPCTYCSKIFKTEGGLSMHMKAIHDNFTHVCEICGKHVKAIKRHMKNHEDKVLSECNICRKLFSSEYISRHVDNVHGNKERKHMCDVCGSTFKSNIVLKNHKRIHVGERKYKCSICSKTFKFESVLHTHQRIHSGLEPYKCSRCNQTFRWKQTFDKHCKKCNE